MREWLLCIVVLFVSCSRAAVWSNWTEVLNLHNEPTSQGDPINVFTDLGAWHGWALPVPNSQYTGGFIGPYLHGSGMGNLGVCLARLRLISQVDSSYLTYSSLQSTYYPGMLEQTFVASHASNGDSYSVTMQLVYASSRTSVVSVSVSPRGSTANQLRVQFSGDARFYSKAGISETSNRLNITTYSNGAVAYVEFPPELMWNIAIFSNISYTATASIPSAHPSFYFTQSVVFSEEEWERESDTISTAFKTGDIFFEKASSNWGVYLSSLLHSGQSYQVQWVIVKSLLTLITNWKSPLYSLQYDALFPSYTGYTGFWGWDSWKHAAALAHFNPDLAMQHILALYAVQNRTTNLGFNGMIPDVFFPIADATNWANTKPPLSVWAVNEIMEQTQDRNITQFLQQVYPYMVLFHEWWFNERDHNKNGLCEFGSTDGGLQTAKFESGMDNAARFDDGIMIQNGPSAYSMNRDSVDLNSYLYAEKLYLAKVATLLNNTADAAKFTADAAKLLSQIQQVFYNPKTGFFQDAYFNGSFVNSLGCEGYIPIFTGAATQTQAKTVVENLMNSDSFLTFVPFPTLAKNDPAFNATGYWRGPVWLDQVYFGVKGLQNYNYTNEAQKVISLLLSSADGLQAGSQLPFTETYDPLTGVAMGVPHFGWSASSLILLLSSP